MAPDSNENARRVATDPDVVNTAKIGIFAGSLLSGVVGAFMLSRRG